MTHRYLIEPLSGAKHVKTLLSSRFVTFYHSLINTKKTAVRFLARLAEDDQRTVLGRTLGGLLRTCELKDHELVKLSAGLVKKHMVFRPPPVGEEWRIPLAQELLLLRQDLDLPGFDKEEREDILKFICTM